MKLFVFLCLSACAVRRYAPYLSTGTCHHMTHHPEMAATSRASPHFPLPCISASHLPSLYHASQHRTFLPSTMHLSIAPSFPPSTC